jgi:Domain of unknown function (DUF1989)
MRSEAWAWADGSEPVDEFVEQLADAQKQVAVDNQIDRLNMLRPNDPPLPFPRSSQVEGEYALRLRALPGHLPPLAQPLRPLAHVQKGHGSVLYSRRSRPLMTIVEDDVGTHDFLYAPCSPKMFEIGYGVSTPHPNCLENLTASLAAFVVPRQRSRSRSTSS